MTNLSLRLNDNHLHYKNLQICPQALCLWNINFASSVKKNHTKTTQVIFKSSCASILQIEKKR